MESALTAFFEMVRQFLSTKQTEMKNKTSLEVVKDKKSLKRATNYTEELIEIVDKYTDYFTKKDLSKYNSLKKKFNKNN